MKRLAAQQAAAAGEDVPQHDAREEAEVRRIARRAFVAAGLLEG